MKYILMKKILLICLLCVMCVMPATAQLRFGVSGGILMNNVSLSGDAKDVEADNYTGWYVGPTLELGIPVVGVKFDASLHYAQNGAQITVRDPNTTQTSNLNSNYISVPLNVKFNFGIGSLASVFLSGGPQFDWAVGTRDFKVLSRTVNMASSQVSANVGAGFRILNRFQIGAYYNIPFGKATDGAINSVEFKNSLWKANFLILF